ncbi:MAG: Clp protease N-terminal domain-containing protein [Caldilineaceae bacterium]
MQVGFGKETTTILRDAEQIAGNMKDEYISTEHLLMAMASAPRQCQNAAQPPRRRLQIAILQALATCGNQRVTTDNPEG